MKQEFSLLGKLRVEHENVGRARGAYKFSGTGESGEIRQVQTREIEGELVGGLPQMILHLWIWFPKRDNQTMLWMWANNNLPRYF